ncbi:multidrug resistance protein 1 [Coprinopsis marcescibilis]|uniref:Multidrug resistance protein 1 n=1 Tax=Coprinopsis marcescibilis TaxID=230819 RepID=A0A5C3KS00_COPMA|nr:multidrug resistance protein 1 [Coprinopsis marcescibilis]
MAKVSGQEPPAYANKAPKVESPSSINSKLAITEDEKASSKDAQFDSGEDDKSSAPSVASIGIFELFRFATRFEILIDIIGLIAAAISGCAQPLMSVLFGNLTQDFVNFGTVTKDADAGSAEAAARVPAAAEAFRRSSGVNASYLVYIGIGMFAVTYIYMYIWVYTGEINAKRVREKYLQAVLRQDIAYFDRTGAGEVATRIQTDTHLLQLGTSDKVPMIVKNLSSFVTGFVVAYTRSWRLALAMSSIVPCNALTGYLLNRFGSKYMLLSLKYVAEGGSLAEEVLSTVRTAQAFGTQRRLSALYDKTSVDKPLRVAPQGAMWYGVTIGIFAFVAYAAYALAFHFGTTLVNAGHAQAGDTVSVIFAVIIGSYALANTPPEFQAITHAQAAAAKLYETIDRVPDIDSANEGGLKPKEVAGEITLENVNFSYPSRPTVQVVKNLSLTFKAGKTAALVGASGSGKSTIVSFLERFYDPSSGVVRVDGIDIRDLNLKWLRSQIGLVSQEPVLFATTIKGNVAHGLINTIYENASEEEKFALIKEACVKANADGFINKLPNGYDTMVGERGFLLSGGQKQRIAIARAIVSDPKILLLDEATSALDTQSEGVVQDALDKAASGRTTITIAHRLSTIKDADIIYVMSAGEVLESGKHEELIAANGAYAQLVHAQQLREAVEETRDDESAEMIEILEANHPLTRRGTNRSFASDAQNLEQAEQGDNGAHTLTHIFKRMSLIVRDRWKHYFIAFACSVATGMTYPAFGLVFATGIDSFSAPTADERRFKGDRTALWLFVVAVLATAAIALSNYFYYISAAALTARLRSLSFKAMMRQDIEYFDRDENNTGSLTSRLSSNPQKVHGLAGVTLGAILQAVATIIAGAILGLAFIWKIGLVGIACMPLLISPGYIRMRMVVMKDESNKKAHEDSAQVACEAASAIRTVAALTREDDCVAMYSKSLEKPLQRSNKTAAWSQALYGCSQGIAFCVIALVFWYGSQLVANREATVFQFYVGLMCTTFAALESGSIFAFVPDMSSAKGAGSDIIKLLDSMPEIDAESDAGKKVDPVAVKGHLRFDNVHFRYPTRPAVRVLRDFSFEVQPGSYIALVGASGSGKSTVIQLVERFYDTLAGDIYLDGEKISDLNVQEYRKQLALVSQEPTLYSGTVRFNILLGATKPESEVTQEDIEKACRDANILDFIQTLPEGFDTEVGGKGSQLSGGQKQRIAIARALLRNPKLLLLDEATSALDSNSEKVVQAALDQAAKGRTTIAIAHRLSTIQNADCIYFVKEGRISESGTHDQLLATRGDYYEYVQLQGLNN